jgi:hypothetical protein
VTVPDRMTFAAEFRRRIVPQLLFFLVLWPLLSIVFGAVLIREQPITEIVPFGAALLGIAAGAAHLFVELFVLGALAALFGALLFAATRGNAVWIEPAAMLLAAIAGFATEYPALLRHPMLMPLRGVSVLVAMIVVAAIAVGAGLRARRPGGNVGHAAAVAIAFAVAALIAKVPPASENREAPRDSIFLLALDSLSQEDPLPLLRQTIARAHGTWYENPVTPGLVTNAVWTSIVQNRLPHETGVFLTFQRPDWKRSPYHLVRDAKARGFETWSFYSDQFTSYVGSIAGFDVNRSGPKGWLQLATATAKDAHVLAPVLLARMPRIPLARTPRNQSGTYAYSLATELRDFFTAGNQKVFAAGHMDYLHQAAYPSMSELTSEERRRVRAAKVGVIWDLSLHWQYPELEGEPIGIYNWKMARLQTAIADVLRDTGVADPARRNRIVIFSDHGNRKDVGLRDFARRRYYKVILSTINIPPRDSKAPLSLLDIPRLLGWNDPSRPHPAELAVEYTNVVTDAEYDAMLQTARLIPDGELALHPQVTSFMGKRLLAYRPHSGKQEYVVVPSIPVEATR